MKRFLAITAAVALGLTVEFVARSAFIGTFLTGLISINGTSNSPPQIVSSVLLQKFFAIQNSGLASTNELMVNLQASLDGSNFVTLATYQPAITNATNDSFILSASANVYLRAQTVTTNSVGVGIQFQ